MNRKPAVLVLIAILCLSSCFNPLDIPQKIRVKGSPAMALPLGKKTIYIDEFLSPEVIGGMGDGMKIYEYAGDNEVKTFLLHYSIPALDIDIDADKLKISPESDGNGDATLFSIQIPAPGPMRLDIALGAGGIPANTAVPLTGTRPAELVFVDSPDAKFVDADIEEGYLELGAVDDGYNYGGVKLTLDGEPLPSSPSEPRRFPLEGRTIKQGSKLAFTGSISKNSYSTEISIILNPRIESFTWIEIRTQKEHNETIDINLTDMADWVEWVQLTRFGTRITVDPPIEGNYDVTIDDKDPRFFWKEPKSETISGKNTVEFDSPGLLEFVSSGAGANTGDKSLEFTPKGDSVGYSSSTLVPQLSLKVAPRSGGETKLLFRPREGQRILTGKKFEVIVRPEPLIGWEEAAVYPSRIKSSKFKEETFPEGAGIDLAGLLEGSDSGMDFNRIEFEEITLRLYLDAPSEIIDKIQLNLEALGVLQKFQAMTYSAPKVGGFQDFEIVEGMEIPSLEEVEGGGIYDKVLPVPQFMNKLEITGIFNQAPKPKNFQLRYTIRFNEGEAIRVRKSDTGGKLQIKPDVLIELPFRFKIKPKRKNDAEAVLSFPGLVSNDSGEDMFGRGKDEDEDKEGLDLFKSIKTVGLDITYTNTIGLKGSRVYLVAEYPRGDDREPWSACLVNLEEGRDLEADPLFLVMEELPNPFCPMVEIRTDTGTYLEIKRRVPDDDGDEDEDGDEDKGPCLILNMSARVETGFDETFTL